MEVRELAGCVGSSGDRDGGEPGMLTRAQVATRLGISLAEVKRRERVGLIEPAAVNAKGWHLYASTQLDYIRNCTANASQRRRLGERDAIAYSGEEAAQVFAALDSGLALKECVKRFAIHPSIIEAIAAAWARLDEGLFVSGEVMSELNRLPLNGTFPVTGDRELLNILKDAATELCVQCGSRARQVCAQCAV
jgi:hypothetical protein